MISYSIFQYLSICKLPTFNKLVYKKIKIHLYADGISIFYQYKGVDVIENVLHEEFADARN